MSVSAVDGIEVGLDEYELLIELAVGSALRRRTLTGFVTRLLVHRAPLLRRDCRTRIAAQIIDFRGATTPEDEVVWRHALRALEEAARSDRS